MAFFANLTAADLKKSDIIMFTMGSSSPGRVGQFACAPMSCSVFSTIVDVTNNKYNGGCGVCFGDKKGSRKGFA